MRYFSALRMYYVWSYNQNGDWYINLFNKKIRDQGNISLSNQRKIILNTAMSHPSINFTKKSKIHKRNPNVSSEAYKL